MSRFFVGQRVRVNMPESTMHGDETVVLAVEVVGRDHGIPYVGNEVALTANSIPRLKHAIFEDHELTPILPEGAAPSTWDACLWRPDGSHKKVAEEGGAVALRSSP